MGALLGIAVGDVDGLLVEIADGVRWFSIW